MKIPMIIQTKVPLMAPNDPQSSSWKNKKWIVKLDPTSTIN